MCASCSSKAVAVTGFRMSSKLSPPLEHGLPRIKDIPINFLVHPSAPSLEIDFLFRSRLIVLQTNLFAVLKWESSFAPEASYDLVMEIFTVSAVTFHSSVYRSRNEGRRLVSKPSSKGFLLCLDGLLNFLVPPNSRFLATPSCLHPQHSAAEEVTTNLNSFHELCFDVFDLFREFLESGCYAFHKDGHDLWSSPWASRFIL